MVVGSACNTVHRGRRCCRGGADTACGEGLQMVLCNKGVQIQCTGKGVSMGH